MKILALRGENLASLPAFSVDLDGPPLGETGIFAITGPTGAGKSTLLDAMCLALYDRVPRLAGARRGGAADDVSASDPRLVMRQGAGEAFAEVDFRGVDGVTYRARWEVWRARRKAEGRLQDQRLHLQRLDRDGARTLTENRKTDTLHAISERVGLGFDEFRRAALLAQGDFAAFLKARPEARAALLERMTGTELYARLSVAAFERAKRESAALDLARRELDAVAVLGGSQRTDLERALTEAGEARTELEASLADAEQARSWHERRGRLLAEQREAERTLAKALASAETLPELESRRAWQLAVAELSPRHTERSRATEALRSLEQEHDAAVQRGKAATRSVAAAERARSEATTVRAAATAARETWAPRLREAAELTRALNTTRRAAQDLAVDFETAELELCAAEDDARSWHRRAEALAEAERESARWQSLRPHLAEGDLGRREADLERWVDLLRQAESLGAVQMELEQQAKGADEDLRLAQDRLTREAESSAASQRALQAAEAAWNALDDHPFDRGAFERWARAIRDTRRVVDEHAARRRRRGRLASQAEQARARARAAAARAELERRQSGHTELEAEIERLRRALAEGVACPVCGSTHHPGVPNRSEASPSSGSARQEELEALAVASEREGRRQQLEEADAQAETAWVELRSGLARIWLDAPDLHRAGLPKVGLLLPEAVPNTRSALSPALAQLDLVETEVEGWTDDRAAAQETRRKAEMNHVRATEAVNAASAELRSAERAKAAAEARRAAGQQRAANLAERRATLEPDLRAAFVAWPERADFDGDPVALLDAVRAAREEVESRQRAERERELALTELTAHRPAVEHRVAAAKARVETAEHARTQAGLLLGSLIRRRYRVLEGRRAEEVASELEERAQAAEAAWTRATADHDRARESALEAETRRNLLVERRPEVQAERDRTEARWVEALERHPREDHARLAAAAGAPLDQDPEQLRIEIEAIKTGLAAAEATVQDRRDRSREHAQFAPALDVAAATAAVAKARKELDALVERAATLRSTLTRDDLAREKRRTLGPKLMEREQAAALWAEMSELIGSADGRKLRGFAQGLTLELLVEQANLHLRTLRPRYALRRADGTMALEVVDLDLGEERRGLESLSGGETFLASLALALGLSDLSARTVQVESLFVDEGFGALDVESLEATLSALDQLQATGRAVGLVSHVPEVAERIGYEIRVRPVSPGRSAVEVKGP